MLPIIIPTSHANHLAQDLEKHYDVEVLKPEIRQFPDSETYVRVPEVKNRDVVVLCSDKNDADRTISEVHGITCGLKYGKAKSKKFFGAYFPYGRPDKKFKRGEANRAKEECEYVSRYYDQTWLLDYHSNHKFVSKLGILRTSAVGLLKEKAEKEYEIDIYITPDTGAQERTGILGDKKKRLGDRKIVTTEAVITRGMVENKTVGIVDDLVSTGGTLCKKCEEMCEMGVDKVLALETHGVLHEGIIKIGETFDKLFLTDSIDRKEANVHIHPLIAEKIDII